MKSLTIYRSSAGSGKTYTLVKEYLQIALQYPMQFRQILAITFTNKATAEMKGRIIKALGELANGNDSALANELKHAVKLNKCTLQERAAEVLTNILHHYSDFSVSTIDSFFNNIVKSLAHELKLSLRFEIEIDQDVIINKACEQLLNQVGNDKEIKHYLEQFIEYKLAYDKGWKIKDELLKIARHLFDDTTIDSANNNDDNAFKNIIKQLLTIRSAYEKTMAGFGLRFIKLLESHGYTADHFSHKKSGIAGYFQKIITVQKPEEYNPKARVLEISINEEKWLSAENRKDSALVNLIRSELHPLLIELLRFHSDNFILYNSALESLKLVYVSAILAKINLEIIHYRDENSIITLPDANRLIRSSVQSSDTPLIFEKTGNFYSHYLLDEFQDTSTIQWENIRPLIHEVLANNKSALLVGDVKQSIYRWRGGNMSLLHEGVEKDLSMFTDQIGIKQLSINYRSSKQIVDFNNSFFVNASTILESYNGSPLPLVREAYGETLLHQQLPEKYNDDGYVKINFIDKNTVEENEETEHWLDRSLNIMLSKINELLSLNYNYGEIAILVRSNKQGNLVANFLYKNGIHQILSNDSLLLTKAPQVNFIVNCLRMMIDPDNPLLKKEIEWFLSNQSVLAEDMHQFFDTNAPSVGTHPLLTGFYKLMKDIARFPVDEVVTHIISHFGLNTVPDAYIQRLQDVTIEYLEKNISDIPSFIKWWDAVSDKKGFSVIMPAASNSIQIITIHKAKGLQFKIVMMPFAEWDLKPKPGGILWAPSVNVPPFDKLDEWPLASNKNLEETVFKSSFLQSVEENYIDNLNLLYVAFTRACQQLYINVLRKKDSRVKTNSDLILDTLKSFPALNTDGDTVSFGILKPKRTGSTFNDDTGIFSPGTAFLNKYPINKWQHKLSLKTDKTFTSAEIETGLLVHKALSLLHHEKELPQVLLKIKGMFHLTDKDVISLNKELTALFKLCSSKKWFDGSYTSINETTFLDADGLSHRPDRVMIKDKEAIVIDYKTGEENDSYRNQVLGYKQLLMECGYPDTTCWLAYTTLKKVVAV